MGSKSKIIDNCSVIMYKNDAQNYSNSQETKWLWGHYLKQRFTNFIGVGSSPNLAENVFKILENSILKLSRYWYKCKFTNKFWCHKFQPQSTRFKKIHQHHEKATPSHISSTSELLFLYYLQKIDANRWSIKMRIIATMLRRKIHAIEDFLFLHNLFLFARLIFLCNC